MSIPLAATRRLRRRPGTTVVAVATLAVGAGSTAALLGVVNNAFLRPLPYPGADALYSLLHTAPGMGLDEFPQADETYVHYSDNARAFSSLGLHIGTELNLSGEGEPERVPAAQVSAAFFEALAVPPALGRWLAAEEEDPAAAPVAVLGHDLWVRRYGADPDVVGRRVEIEGRPTEVVGVMPRGFHFPDGSVELWVPYPLDRSVLPTLAFGFGTVGRLAPEVTLERADEELNRLLQTLPDAFPGGITHQMLEDGQMTAFARPLRDEVVGDSDALVLVLLLSAGLVLTIALANVANLFLVRGEGSRQEVAVRSAMGASRWSAARHLVEEGALAGTFAGILGVGLAWGLLHALVALAPAELPRLEEIGLDGLVVALSLAVGIVSGAGAGLLAMARVGGLDAADELRGSGRGTTGSRGNRFRFALVLGEMALSVVLLVGGGLMVLSFMRVRTVDPGFRTEDVLSFQLILPEASYPDPESVSGFYDQLTERLAALSGVTSVGTTSRIPTSATTAQDVSFVLEDHPPAGPDDLPRFVRLTSVDPGYFETLGIPLLEGRAFEPDDHRVPNPVAVVSRAFAQEHWPGASPLGRRMTRGNARMRAEWLTIVGVVEDAHDDAPNADRVPAAYFPVVHPHASGNPVVARERGVLVRASSAGGALGPGIRRAVWALDPKLPIVGMAPLEDIVASSTAQTTFVTLLLIVASGVAVLLSAGGLYGVVSYVVGRRTREIGVRMALGARAGQVRGMVVRQGLAVAAAGVVLGALAAAAGGRVLESFLFEVSAAEPLILGGAPLLLLTVAAAACWLPARRASRLDPMRALTDE